VAELAPKPAKELFLKHYNSLTFGNELKPESVLDYDATIAYMEANGGDQVNPQITLRAARPCGVCERTQHTCKRTYPCMAQPDTGLVLQRKLLSGRKCSLGIQGSNAAKVGKLHKEFNGSFGDRISDG